MIDQAAHDAADAVPWVLDDTTVEPREERQGLGRVRGAEYGTTYFVEHVRLQLLEYGFTDDQIYGGGLRVYTTLDHQAQRAAYETVVETLDQPDDPLASLVAIDGDGMVRAMMAGRDFAASELNLATFGGGIGRQPGLVDEAVRARRRPRARASRSTPGSNRPAAWSSPGPTAATTGPSATTAAPSRACSSLLDATRVSSNTAYAQLMLEVGARGRGRPRPSDGDRPRRSTPSTPSCSAPRRSRPSRWPTAYGTFANGGVHIEPLTITRVVRSDGSVVHAAAGSRAGARPRPSTPRSILRAARRGRPGHGHRGPPRRAGRRQDRHHPGQPRRLVRRLPAERHDRGGLDGLRHRRRRRRRRGRRRPLHELACTAEPSPAGRSRRRCGTTS